MCQNFAVGFTFLCHCVCAVLAHSHTVTVARYRKSDVIAVKIECKFCAAQIKKGTELCPRNGDGADYHAFYMTAVG